MPSANTADVREAAVAACPTVTNPEQVAQQAVRDAAWLADGVRQMDPREMWGTLALWNRDDPTRLYGAVTALAAMLPTDHTIHDLLAWTDRCLHPVRGVA